ncbi:centrosomal protein kizuna isoform X2 [Oxyura jamaicensis]|uniref:centrosomal protein kizuna isoform X2 n=1 Tax=Oxyura jamaicensis TaxID=8884 RepID=UPI0015A4FA88|nr:centrosomal protein kizuna isoform X2 [Oxyura jamaicensis]
MLLFGEFASGKGAAEAVAFLEFHSETRRLELERKLMGYKKSDAYLMKLKYMKLKKYLEEINERQKRALLQNQAILKELNQFEAHMKTSSSELIQKMEWYGREIKSVLSLREGNLSARGDEEEYNKQNPWVVRQTGIHSGTAMSRGLYHPATIFMGRHTSAAWSMQQKAPQAAESCSVPKPCSHRQAVPSSDKTDRCLPRVGSDMPCTNKPDKQDGKADALVREKMPITSRVALAESSMHSSLTNFTEYRNPAEYRLLSPSRVSVESRMADLNSDTSVEQEEEEVACEHLVASAEDYKQPIPVAFLAEPSISEEDQESIPGPQDGLSNGQPSKTVSVDSSSKPLVCPGEGMLMPAGSRTWAGGTHPAEVSSPEPSSPCTAEEEPLGSLAPDGFCSQASSLKEEDLKAGETAVCHQPKVLLQSLWGGHPLPGNIPCAAHGAVEQSRLDLPRDVDVLQAPLSSPTAHCSLLKEEVAATFENLLVSEKEASDDQAPPLLREVLLGEECGDGSSIQSNESSYSLPSIPNDSGEIKQAKHSPRLDATGKQGCDIGNDSSKTKSQEMCSERSSSSERSGDLSRTEIRKGFVTAIKSKAFWGVSDDSSSENEAALHPQIHSTEADEFDDFYD